MLFFKQLFVINKVARTLHVALFMHLYCTQASDWTIVEGMDNLLDLFPCCQIDLNVSVLEQQCEDNKWCAGFSSHFGTLKYSVADLGSQPNTDLFIRNPAPPPLPPQPPFSGWPRPRQYSAGPSSNVLFLQNTSFSFDATGASFPLLQDTLSRYRSILFGENTDPLLAKDTPTLSGCNVFVQSDSIELQADMVESYQLHIPSVEDAVEGVRANITGASALSFSAATPRVLCHFFLFPQFPIHIHTPFLPPRSLPSFSSC